MIKYQIMRDIEKSKKIKMCSKENIKKLKKNFFGCLEKNNNKIEYCQEYRNKLETCIKLKKIK